MDPEDHANDDVYPDDDDVDYLSEDDHDASNFDDDDINPIQPNKDYKALTEADIRQRMEESVSTISFSLSLSRFAATVLLLHHRWNPGKAHEAWSADEQLARKSIGLPEPNRVRGGKRKNITCGICMEEDITSVPCDAPPCSHTFCTHCWKAYITGSIKGGPGCLFLRCPEPGCGLCISGEMIRRLAEGSDYEKYKQFFINSYVEGDIKTKWCPWPGCEFAVEFDGDNDSYDVLCRCSHGFCWNCTEESHRPVDCDTAAKWIAKNIVESDNVTWILAYTKRCPKCKKPIETNQGCNHMTCRPPCNYQFCWLCLGDYYNHTCNRYETEMNESRREVAKMENKRYTHYFERWAANRSSQKKALEDLRDMESVKLDTLSRNQSQSLGQHRFITDAWTQIVECRQILKWTYAFGYYLPRDEIPKKRLFEYMQGEAELGLERLHSCAEKDFQGFVDAKGPLENFNNFRTKLMDLTSITRNYFENLVKALKNGLSDVESPYGRNRASNYKETRQLPTNLQAQKFDITTDIRNYDLSERWD